MSWAKTDDWQELTRTDKNWVYDTTWSLSSQPKYARRKDLDIHTHKITSSSISNSDLECVLQPGTAPVIHSLISICLCLTERRVWDKRIARRASLEKNTSHLLCDALTEHLSFWVRTISFFAFSTAYYLLQWYAQNLKELHAASSCLCNSICLLFLFRFAFRSSVCSWNIKSHAVSIRRFYRLENSLASVISYWNAWKYQTSHLPLL